MRGGGDGFGGSDSPSHFAEVFAEGAFRGVQALGGDSEDLDGSAGDVPRLAAEDGASAIERSEIACAKYSPMGSAGGRWQIWLSGHKPSQLAKCRTLGNLSSVVPISPMRAWALRALIPGI